MIVKVVPVFPIAGILPKNKCIIDEMVLDLNKNEIMHCMQSGNVYDEDGNVIDKYYLNKIGNVRKIVNKPVVKVSEQVTLEPEKIVKEDIIETLKEVTEEIIEDIIPEYNLEVVSMFKDEYINLEVEFTSNVEKLEGTLYGIFDITKGTRPTVIEYNKDDNWVTFAKKFTDFKEIKNGDKLKFRMLPKNDSAFTFNLSIKEKNVVITSVSDEISFE